jgi:glutamate/aspartate transport system substrate-binding protein
MKFPVGLHGWLLAPIAIVLGIHTSHAAAGETLDRILRRDQINIGYRSDAPPFSFHDSKGQPVGYSVELCAGIAERIRSETGKPQLRVKYMEVDADQLARLVSSGGVDLMCAGTSDTAERRRNMGFSPPIFVSAIKFMVRSKDKFGTAGQLKGQTVAVLGRTTAESAVAAYSSKAQLGLNVSRTVSADAALGQLQLGQAGAYARDEVLLLGQRMRLQKPEDYMVLPEAISTEVIAIALPKGDALLQKMVDQEMAQQVRSGKLKALYEQWFVKPRMGDTLGLNLAMPAELASAWDRLR